MMGLQIICERCGNPMRAWYHDMYGKMCAFCKKSGAEPSERQKRVFNETCDKLQAAEKFLRDNEK